MVADGCRWLGKMVVDGWERYGGGKLKSGPRKTNLASNNGGEGPLEMLLSKQILAKTLRTRVIYFNGKDWTDKNHMCNGDATEGNTIDFPLI